MVVVKAARADLRIVCDAHWTPPSVRTAEEE
jgi:hypothetical protein